MNHEEQLKRMRLEINGDETDTSKDGIFELKLEDAEMVALDTLYPYDKQIQKLPNEMRLKNWQVRCAIELYKKMSTTNVQSYSENGLSVTYLSGLISSELMNELFPPKADIPR